MKAIETVSSVVLVVVGVAFCISSVSMGLGRVHDPGPGLIPFGAGCLLILLTLATVLESHLRKEKEGQPAPFEGKRWGLVVWILVSIFVYAFALSFVGFLPGTFLLLIFLFKISGVKSWKGALGASILTTAIASLLFDYLFQCNLPKGFLGF